MEKNTVLAIVLSTLVLIVFFAVQGIFFPPAPPPAVEQQPQIPAPLETTQPAVQQAEVTQAAEPFQEIAPGAFIEDTEISLLPPIEIRTELFTAVLTNAGGNLVSFKWRDQRDDSYVDLIFGGYSEPRAFTIAFGDPDTQPITQNFNVNRISDYSIEFYRYFTAPEGRFRMTKRYDFVPTEFMFELTISLDGGFSVPGFNFDGNAYTLSFGPQIGPVFERLDGQHDYRQYHIFINGRRRNARVNELIDNRPTWAAISGKYFAFIAIPYLPQFSLSFSERPEPGLISASRLNIIRPAVNASRVSDTYRFYLGPRTQEILVNYNTGRNEFGIRDASLVEVASTRGFWGIFSPLERVLKFLLVNIYAIVPNYGVAIILLTFIIKILFFPLTKKGSMATLRMQALAPKIKELQEKHKGNPKKLNTEMAALYQKEGYNPISGCLPMLLQMPIFIAMFSLFNNHFDLRGAMFIVGWIPDLSVPESIIDFPEGFRLPLLGWTALRGLPFIYVGSQLMYGKVTQMPSQQSAGQMKMMLYVLPIVFFFVLYNMPSGLLIYWIFSNLLTLVQQVIINKFILAKKQTQPEPQPVIAPRKKKSK